MTAGGGWHLYRWRQAPTDVATRRQLRAHNLVPTGEPVGVLTWRRGRRLAYLYPITTARPVGPFTAHRRTALAAAMRTRATCTLCGTCAPCTLCGTCAPYCLPTRGGRYCLDCRETPTTVGKDTTS